MQMAEAQCRLCALLLADGPVHYLDLEALADECPAFCYRDGLHVNSLAYDVVLQQLANIYYSATPP